MSSDPNVPDPRRWWALGLLCLAQFLIILDTSIVGIALPAIQRALNLGDGGVPWIFNAYVIAFGGLVLLGGRLSDLFGARRMFGLGFVGLTTASLVAGLADSGAVLLAARAGQGIGAALIAPASLSLLMTLFAGQPSEMRRALGFWGAAAAAGGTAGVFLGGVITQWLSWRWTFLVNVPIGIVAIGAIRGTLPVVARMRGAIDVLGALLVTSSLTLAVYAIVTANAPAATSASTLGLLATSAALAVGFVVVQLRRKEPLIPLAIFRAPNLAAGNIAMALLGAAWIPMWFFLNLYLQQVLGYGAFESGLALLPMTATIMTMMTTTTERIVGKIGPKTALVLGLTTLGAALLLFARMPVEGSFLTHVLVPSLLGAAGMSLAYIPAMITATAGARPAEGGLASGLVNTTYQVGSAIGLAVMVAVAGSRTGSLAGDGIDRVHALTGGFSTGFLGAAVVAFAAAVITVFAVRAPHAVRTEPAVVS